MNFQRHYKKVNRINGFLKFISTLCCVTAIAVSGYFFLGHKDSKAQQFYSSIESFFDSVEDSTRDFTDNVVDFFTED